MNRMLRLIVVPAAALNLMAASPPQRGLSLTVPDSNSPLLAINPPNPPPPAPLGQRFAPAPLPNRDVDAPLGPRASDAPSISPSLVTRRDQFRGDGFSPNSSAQTEQERRLKPGAGFNLHVPLTGQ